MVKFKRIKVPTMALVNELMQDMRKPDIMELLMGPVHPDQAVFESIANSRYCYAVRDKENNLLAVTGIAAGQIEVAGTMATPVWFLGTKKAYRHNRALVYYGKQFCEQWIYEVGPLCNYIWIGNEPSIRYIRHLGARLLPPEEKGKHREMFIPFILSDVKR